MRIEDAKTYDAGTYTCRFVYNLKHKGGSVLDQTVEVCFAHNFALKKILFVREQ